MADLRGIEVVAVDFDGTLIEADHSIVPECLEALARAKDAGLKIATASGRSLAQQIEFLALSGLGAGAGLPQALTVDERQVWLLSDGAYVALQPWNEAVDADWRRLRPLAEALTEQILAELAARGVWAESCLGPEAVAARGQTGIRFKGEAAAVANRPLLEALAAVATTELMVSQNWSLTHILPAAAGKGHTLVALAQAWGLAPAQVLAVGDRHNDVGMLDGALGLRAACVGNSVPEIKELVAAGGGYVAQAAVGAGVAEIVGQVLAARR